MHKQKGFTPTPISHTNQHTSVKGVEKKNSKEHNGVISEIGVSSQGERGFTLLEILLVVAAIAILAGIVVVAINPNKQLGDTRDADRRSDVNSILNAVFQYSIDNNGAMPSAIDDTIDSAQVIGTASSDLDDACVATTTVAAGADLSGDLTPTYLVSIPQDPSSGSAENTGYYINKDANGRITVGACDPDQAAQIDVTR